MNTNRQGLFPFESKWIDVGANRIHYTDEGRGDVILFCHPSVATSFMYRNLIRLLSPEYRCIALDFPGFGLSQPAPGYTYTIQSQADVMDGFISKLDLKNIYPVVQEVGGHAALIALLPTPERINGILLTDTIIFPVSEYKRISTMLDFINGSFFNVLNENFNLLIRMTYRFGVRNRKLTRQERQVYKNAFDTKEKRRRITHMIHQLKKEEALLLRIKHAFKTVFNRIPTLLIYGSKDPVYEMGIPQRINNLLAASELHLIEGEGHFPHEGAPDEMVSIIRKWIRKQKQIEK